MPEVTVIIPLYNKGPYIFRTLNSVLNQTFKKFEVIVVDDGSTDNSVEVVRGFRDPRIRLIQQENKGASAARNLGISKATTDFIAFLDADDEWMPSHLDIILMLRKKYPEAGIYTSSYKICINKDETISPQYRFIPDHPWEGVLPDYFRSAATGDYPVNTSTACIPKKIYDEAGGFPEGYWWGEDTDLFGKIALKYPVAFSREICTVYHWDATNRACNKPLPLDYEEPFVKTARNALKKGEVSPEFIESVNELISKMEIPRAERNALAGNPKIAQTILRQCKTKYYYGIKVQWLFFSMIPHPLLLRLQKLKRKLLG